MKKKCSEWLKRIAFIGIPLITILPAYARIYSINGGSMAPTVFVGDRLLVNLAGYDIKFPYTNTVVFRVNDPGRGDLVIYNDPRGYLGMKRIVGIPGDEVELRDNEVFVNGASIRKGTRLSDEILSGIGETDLNNLEVGLGKIFVEEQLGDESYLISYTEGRSEKASYGPILVPKGSYFILGDHRDFSGDSRFEFQGFMSQKQIIGRVVTGYNQF